MERSTLYFYNDMVPLAIKYQQPWERLDNWAMVMGNGGGGSKGIWGCISSRSNAIDMPYNRIFLQF
ncbi:hypothetical protein BpHYR1_047902 [Brachionus plicatilis]|uniref:Uncharacterized protein n=1 Tax=Brachionus plicatilis TaxID=10195 RepID=A0A3M7PGU9_BRAPC|nr:hypothetical protein BpHYR1_047902 [Brachionus plicatilis]